MPNKLLHATIHRKLLGGRRVERERTFRFSFHRFLSQALRKEA
jgi:hypothetical protein